MHKIQNYHYFKDDIKMCNKPLICDTYVCSSLHVIVEGFISIESIYDRWILGIQLIYHGRFLSMEWIHRTSSQQGICAILYIIDTFVQIYAIHWYYRFVIIWITSMFIIIATYTFQLCWIHQSYLLLTDDWCAI